MTVNACNHDYLYQALDSLVWQTLGDFELIFYSKYHADAALANEFCLEHGIDGQCIWSESTTDRTDRFTRAVGEAVGKWVVILDHDDVLHPDALWTVYRCLQRFPLLNYFTSSHRVFDCHSRRVANNPAMPYSQTLDSLAHSFKQRHFWGFRNDSSRWPPNLFCHSFPVEDYWFFAELAINAIAVLHIPHYLYGWRRHPAQWTQAQKDRSEDMCSRIQCRLRHQIKIKPAMWHWGDKTLAVRLLSHMVALEQEIAIGGDG